MKNFKQVSICFIKSNNSIQKINLAYFISTLFFTAYIFLYHLILKEYSYLANYLKTIILTTTFLIILDYIINLLTKNKQIVKVFTKDNILTISLLLSPFLINTSPIILLITCIITIISKKIIKGINLSSILYGILFLYLYRYFTNNLITPLTNLKSLNYLGTYNQLVASNGSISSYILGYNYLSPLISILAFIYLFIKKTTKYNIIFSYTITFTIMMLIIGIFNNMSIWFVLFELVTGNILYLVTYTISDYTITPETSEGQILYGFILGIITVILRFIIPEVSVIISIIFGHLVLTPIVRKIMPNLKYKRKSALIYFGATTIISIIVTIILIILK